MGNRLRQALRTYTTRWLFWVIAAYWALQHSLLVLASIFEPLASRADQLAMMAWPLVCTYALGAMVGSLLKLQFANPRARLVPGFAAAHLIVAGAIIAAAVTGSTWTIAWAGSGSGLAVAGFVLCTVGAVMYSYLAFLALFVVMLMVALGHLSQGQWDLGALILHGNPVVSLTELCAGFAALALLGRRLLMLHEEMAGYCQQMPLIWDFTSRTGRRTMRQWETQAIARSTRTGGLLDVEFRLVFRWLPAWAPLRRLLLRQLSGGSFAPLALALQFAQVVFLVWLQRSTLRTLDPGTFFGFSLLPVVFATVMLHSYLWVRWPNLPRESLYPLTRTDLVGDLFRSSACDTAAVAVGHCAGFLVGLALFRLEGPLAAMVFPYLALTLAQYAVAFCAILWLASFHRRRVGGLGWFVPCVLSAALVTAALCSGDWFSSPAKVVLAVTAVVAAVVVLYRLAFRRWCRVELG